MNKTKLVTVSPQCPPGQGEGYSLGWLHGQNDMIDRYDGTPCQLVAMQDRIDQLESKGDDRVSLSKDLYESLMEDQHWLSCLENAGVDNWDGISFAEELMQEEGGFADEQD